MGFKGCQIISLPVALDVMSLVGFVSYWQRRYVTKNTPLKPPSFHKQQSFHSTMLRNPLEKNLRWSQNRYGCCGLIAPTGKRISILQSKTHHFTNITDPDILVAIW